MTQSSIPPDPNDRYHVVKHGSSWRVEDLLNPNDANGIIYPTAESARKWTDRANDRRRASGSKTADRTDKGAPA